MAKEIISPAEIVARLQMVEFLKARDMPASEAIRMAGMTEARYYRWRAEYDGLRRTLGPVCSDAAEFLRRARQAERRTERFGA